VSNNSIFKLRAFLYRKTRGSHVIPWHFASDGHGSLVVAEELGITSKNVNEMRTSDYIAVQFWREMALGYVEN